MRYPVPAAALLAACLQCSSLASRATSPWAHRGQFYEGRYPGRPRRGPVPPPSAATAGVTSRPSPHFWNRPIRGPIRATAQPSSAVTTQGPAPLQVAAPVTALSSAQAAPAAAPLPGGVGKPAQPGCLPATLPSSWAEVETAVRHNGLDVPEDVPVAGVQSARGASKAVEKWRGKSFIRLPVISLLRFANTECGSDASGGVGTCLLANECWRRGGAASGSCAAGYGVCCVVTRSCWEEARFNNTYFVHPEYPANGRAVRSCVLTVHKVSPDVTQIRLDLLQFQIAGPLNGSCNRDVFTIAGQDSNDVLPAICGLNTGQHLYVEVGERTGPLQLRVVTSSAVRHSWRMRVTQLSAMARAPAHCLQYHTQPNGALRSFNYAPLSNTGGYMNRLNYQVCIRRAAGFCSITYTTDGFAASEEADVFQIVNFRSDDSGGGSLEPTVPDAQAGVGPTQCTADYLLLSSDRLCGERLNDGTTSSELVNNADVTDASAGQFSARFVTDDRFSGQGFQLTYRQNPCTTRQG